MIGFDLGDRCFIYEEEEDRWRNSEDIKIECDVVMRGTKIKSRMMKKEVDIGDRQVRQWGAAPLFQHEEKEEKKEQRR